MKVLQIAVEQPILSGKSIFDYECPDTFKSMNLIGCRVEVPFGKRYTTGIVVAVEERNSIYALKKIISNMDDEPVLTAAQISLAKWMSKYYVCSLYSCFKLMIPKLLNKKRKDGYILTEKGRKALLGNSSFPFLLSSVFIEKVLNTGKLSEEESIKLLEENALQRLLKEKWLVPSLKYYVSRHIDADLVYRINEAYLCKNASELFARGAKKQIALFEFLKLTKNGERSIKEVRSLFSSSVIHALTERNILSTGIRRLEPKMPSFSLNKEQEMAIGSICTALRKKIYRKILLYGITGSGKTEVYIRSILECLKNGRNAMILVPEITLSQQIYERLKERIPNMILLHSGKSDGERFNAWEQVKKGEVKVVLGARSAVFAPLENIGLLIIDEEQELSYKSENMPKYHAEEVARHRMEESNGVFLCGSATPKLESIREAMNGETEMLTLSERVAEAKSPKIIIEDMRQKSELLSPVLKEKITDRLSKHEQTILFVNRRGYSPRVVCMNCGEIMSCPHCTIALVYHRDDERMHCHYCGYEHERQGTCSKCGSNALQMIGTGTQKIEEICIRDFPKACISRLDTDVTQKKESYSRILEQVKEKKIDILIGTQMVAKGLDFPNVSLVGAVDADALLAIPDYRAEERAMQMLTQVSGRAGRADKYGEVIIQSFHSDNQFFECFQMNSYLKFAVQELNNRALMKYPPYGHMAEIVIRSIKEELAEKVIYDISSYLTELLMDSDGRKYYILGPAPCGIYKIQDKYRWQLHILSVERDILMSVLHWVVHRIPILIKSKCELEIDIDPVIS